MKRISAAPEEAEVVDLSHEGRGVAKLDGKAVFVPDALPGERVVLRRVGRRRNFDEAVLERVLRASPDRVPAECPHFGLCGGCALQHLAPSAQIAFKQSQLLESLVRLGGVEPASVLEPLTGPVWGIDGAHGSASSWCHARDGCWSDFASVRRPMSRTCTNAVFSRRPRDG